MPGYDHSSWQDSLSAFFRSHGVEWNVRARPELRVRVAATRFRVPDVTVLSRSAPIEQIILTPPLAVFEILAPENRMAAMMEKLPTTRAWVSLESGSSIRESRLRRR